MQCEVPRSQDTKGEESRDPQFLNLRHKNVGPLLEALCWLDVFAAVPDVPKGGKGAGVGLA